MFEFELPDLGEGVAEGEILEWRVAVGDRVEEDQLLAEVETDKAAVDVPSPVSGVVRERHYEPGDVVETDAVIVSIAPDETAEVEDADTDSEADDTAATAEASDGTSARGGRVFAPPTVRRLARELGVDITTVAGTGPSGRVTESDVRTAAEESEDDEAQIKSAVSRVSSADGEDDKDESQIKSAVSRVSDSGENDANGKSGATAVKSAVSSTDSGAERDQTLAAPATRKLADELDVDIDAVPTDEVRDGEAYVDEAAVQAYQRAQTTEAAGSEEAVAEATETEPAVTDDPVTSEPAGVEGERREPYRGTRRTIGEQMAQSRREVPHATHHDRAIVQGLVAARERLEPLAQERGVDLTYTPLLLKCVATALGEHPILNAELHQDNEEIVYHDEINLGVAAATDHGLVVPVVRNVDEKGLLELARDVNDLVSRARERDLDRSEMQGGTFTVTNFGAIGGEYADPIINVPQTAILGTGALKERAVADDGEVVAKPTLPLSLAIDHRVIDGADAARFANTLKQYLAEPSLLLLE
jgi:pyruvate dehydrogenase E2 component (dihydrolipoamide acetyltransferase)